MKIEVKCLRMDSDGGFFFLQQRCASKDWQFSITYKYTTRDTPQHNHLAELRFAT
jgi:hypothetical protein